MWSLEHPSPDRKTGVNWSLLPFVKSAGRNHAEGVEGVLALQESSESLCLDVTAVYGCNPFFFIAFLYAEELDGLHLHREEHIEENAETCRCQYAMNLGCID